MARGDEASRYLAELMFGASDSGTRFVSDASREKDSAKEAANRYLASLIFPEAAEEPMTFEKLDELLGEEDD